jgi:hypothetical protein
LRLVLVMDEFELLAANPRLGQPLFNRLRGLAARLPVQFVTASRDPLVTLTFAWLQGALTVEDAFVAAAICFNVGGVATLAVLAAAATLYPSSSSLRCHEHSAGLWFGR